MIDYQYIESIFTNQTWYNGTIVQHFIKGHKISHFHFNNQQLILYLVFINQKIRKLE